MTQETPRSCPACCGSLPTRGEARRDVEYAPGALGEGRFAASDFKREIQVVADQFRVIRVDGEDYRHRGLPEAPEPLSNGRVEAFAEEHYGEDMIAADDFDTLCEHLSSVHPSRYRQLLSDVDVWAVKDVSTIEGQALGLRFVVLADRLYDQDVKIVASGCRSTSSSPRR